MRLLPGKHDAFVNYSYMVMMVHIQKGKMQAMVSFVLRS